MLLTFDLSLPVGKRYLGKEAEAGANLVVPTAGLSEVRISFMPMSPEATYGTSENE